MRGIRKQGVRSEAKVALGIAVITVPLLAGCLAGLEAAPTTTQSNASATIDGNRTDAGWFQLVLRVDDNLTASQVHGNVTIHWGTPDASDEDPAEWFCAHWGQSPQPRWRGSHATCTYYHPDGRVEASVEVDGHEVEVNENNPICCTGGPDSSTVDLGEYVADHNRTFFQRYNISVVHFLVFGGGAPIDAISYNITLPPGTHHDWSTGHVDEPFSADHNDFSSTLGIRVDTVGYEGQYYAQEDAHMTLDVPSRQSAYVWYFPYWFDDYATSDPVIEIRLPGGMSFVDDWGFISSSYEPGTWGFAYSRSADNDADRPIIMGTPIDWLTPDRVV